LNVHRPHRPRPAATLEDVLHKARLICRVCAGISILAPALLASPPAAQATGYVYVAQWGYSITTRAVL
jgi:hypothetical protein